MRKKKSYAAIMEFTIHLLKKKLQSNKNPIPLMGYKPNLKN